MEPGTNRQACKLPSVDRVLFKAGRDLLSLPAGVREDDMATARANLGLVPDGMTETEWQTSCDLAAAYQLVDLYGW